MEKRFWILAAGILASVPVNAQPVAPVEGGAGRNEAAGVSIRDLEERIGGRTTLELKFEGATRDQVLAALSQSSGLTFGQQAGPQSDLQARLRAADPARYNADVARLDFWPALRAWNRAEAARLRKESAAEERKRSEDKPPAPPTAGAGRTDEEMQQWRSAQNAWQQRQTQSRGRFSPAQLLSASFDANSNRWSLGPGSEIASGRALSLWPCLILATDFQRMQSLSISEDGPAAPAEPAGAQAAGAQAAADAVGGQLFDSLSLSLKMYLEPKLQAKAQVQLQVIEARDEAGEELLAENDRDLGSLESRPGSGAFQYPVRLKPRQSKGSKIASLRGVVTLRYPMQIQQREITDFSAPHLLPMAVAGYQAQVQIEPPRLEGSRLTLRAVAKVASPTGSRAMTEARRSRIRSRTQGGIFFGQMILPEPTSFLLTDTQGRTWRALGGRRATWTYPQGAPSPEDVPAPPPASPPQPIADDFTYTESSESVLALVPSAAELAADGRHSNLPIIGGRIASDVDVSGSVINSLPPAELAQVRFTKATFTTESDWRTLSIPFEFRDLPLPPR